MNNKIKINPRATCALIEYLNTGHEHKNNHVRIILTDNFHLFRNNDFETGDDFDEISEGALWNGLPKRDINKVFRAADESHLWPINRRFNATERAIRRLRRRCRKGLCLNGGYEYALALDAEISSVVNDPKNL